MHCVLLLIMRTDYKIAKNTELENREQLLWGEIQGFCEPLVYIFISWSICNNFILCVTSVQRQMSHLILYIAVPLTLNLMTQQNLVSNVTFLYYFLALDSTVPFWGAHKIMKLQKKKKKRVGKNATKKCTMKFLHTIKAEEGRRQSPYVTSAETGI